MTSRKSYASVIIAAAAAAALALPTTATAVSEFDPQEPSLAEIQAVESVGIDADELRPGWTVEGQEIVWPDGTMASLVPMAYEDCAATYVCFWEGKTYTGRRLQFHDTGLRGDMRDYSFNDQMSSWRNRRGLDARWYYDYNGTGTSRCMESGTANSDVGAGIWNVDNDEMSSFRIYNNDTSC